jgi:hypothetical protein
VNTPPLPGADTGGYLMAEREVNPPALWAHELPLKNGIVGNLPAPVPLAGGLF